MLAIQVRSVAGTASIHLDVYVYPQRREHFGMDMCAIQKFLFRLISKIKFSALHHPLVHAFTYKKKLCTTLILHCEQIITFCSDS
jgi:hypothetical protein